MSTGTTVRGARRAMILAVIGSLAVAAVIAIVVLLGSDVGETAGRVLLTALTVAAFATTALCHLAVVTRAVRAVGVAGLAAGVGGVACALALIWSDQELPGGEEAWLEALLVLTVVAVSLAQTALLLLVARRPRSVVRAALAVTLLAITAVASMIIVAVLAEDTFGDLYGRLLGVAVIVDALGTIALPVLALVLRRASDGAVVTTVRLELDLPADLAARLDTRVGAGTREAAALDALDRAL